MAMPGALMRLEARDKRALILGSILVVALLAYLLWPRGSDGSSVELVAADQRQGVAAAPAPVQPPPMIAPAPPVAPPAAVPEGLSLTGVAGSGAIFSFADGSQRFIGRGRDVVPGVTLQAVRLRDVILASGAVNYRLPLGGVAVAIQPPVQPPAQPVPSAAGGPSTQLVVPGAARNAMGGPLITEAQQQAMGQQLVGALEPRQASGRVTGWTIRPGAGALPLAQAGLQPGDVLIAVNGEAVMDQEQVTGLGRQIANGTRVEFEFERGGQRMRRALDVNPRR
jgi:membrane-associated protease RseP (regulator of RpoE activity)